jgi:hypothetical protein
MSQLSRYKYGVRITWFDRQDPFSPGGAKFLTLKTANVDVAANLCMDCGHVALVGDTEKVKALMDT